MLFEAAEAELASKPTSAADDERLLQVRAVQPLAWGEGPRGASSALCSGRPPRPRCVQTPHLMSPRQRAAAEFRLEKKRLLERAAAKARKRLGKAA